MVEFGKNMLIFAYLLILSIYDIREKKVPVSLLAAGGIGGLAVIGYGCIMGENHLWHQVLGILPGVFLVIVAWITKKAGYADGILLGILGIIEGYRVGCLVLCFSLLILSGASIILLFLHKVGRQTQIPYIPFLSGTYVLLHIFN